MRVTAELRDRLRSAKGVVFDMDGTLVLADKGHTSLSPIAGALDITHRLRELGIPFVVVTSGSAQTPSDYTRNLRNVGFPLGDTGVQTPATVAADYFVRRKLRRIMVLGWKGAWGPLKDAGIEVVQPAGKVGVDGVFIGYYRDFSIDHLDAACHAIWRGAKLFTSAYSPFFAAADGRAIGIPRGICRAIQGITGCGVKVLGKPSIETLRTAGRFLGADPAHLVVVGDDPTLETGMAHRGKAMAIGVTSGIATAADFAALAPRSRPHILLDNVGGLCDLFR